MLESGSAASPREPGGVGSSEKASVAEISDFKRVFLFGNFFSKVVCSRLKKMSFSSGLALKLGGASVGWNLGKKCL
jgi:hypothetical protein